MPSHGLRPLRLVLSLSSLLLAAALMLLALAQENQAQEGARQAWVLTIDGSIGPVTSDYFQRGLERAEEANAELLILRLDTPGGLDAAMRDMIQAMLSAEVPVVVYVAPDGARAASAGTYLLYASHVAAMAPATHLGSATPVQIGGGGFPGDEPPQDEPVDEEAAGDEGGDDEASEENKRRGETAMERKILEDAVATIRSLAERHGRNADWAERAVREAVNLTAREALERNVIDVLARDLDDLLQQIDGMTVIMADGERQLNTVGLVLVRVEPDWRTELLSLITDPNVAYLLMIVGFYGLLFELISPGALFPGVIGAICLLLALFAFQVLPINYAGLALILLGLGLIVGEALMPSFGILGFGGVVAFVFGSVMLMDDRQLAISLPLIGGVALVASGFMLWMVMRFMKLRRRHPRTGQEGMLGASAMALHDFTGHGYVHLHGERWRAHSAMPVSQGQRLTVVAVRGLTVEVAPADSSPAPRDVERR